MVDANLLVTFDPVHTESAKKEIEGILKEVKETFKILKADEGLAELSVKDARKAVKAVMPKSKKLEYTFRWWPVDKWCKADVKDMQKCIAELQKDIKKEDKWKMELAKRKTNKEYGKDIIIKLTEVIDKPKVDLDKPDKIVKVEIVGPKAAISVFGAKEMLVK